MKSIILMIVLLGVIVYSQAFPINDPIIGENYGNPKYNIQMTGNRSCKEIDIVCVDTLNIYMYIEDNVLLKIPRSQIVTITPELPMNSFVYKEYAEASTTWDDKNLKIFVIKPTNKYVVRASISEIDHCGGVSVDINLYNFSKNRLKYAIYTVKYYNAVNDLLLNDVGDYSSQRCKATGFIEPGTIDSGRWEGFYNSTADYIKIPSMTLIYSSGKQENFERNGVSMLLIEN